MSEILVVPGFNQVYAKNSVLAATTTGNGASKIGIEDSGSHYTGTTVETALKEIGDGTTLRENALTKVATVSGVDMKTAASTTLFTVPTGKTFYCTSVIIRNNTASLAGGTSYAFTTWRSGIDLSGMTVTTGARRLSMTDNTTFTPIAAGGTFQITVTTGSTAACTATIDVFGYLV